MLCLSQFGGMAIAMLKLMPAMTEPGRLTWFVFFGFNFSYLAGYGFSSVAASRVESNRTTTIAAPTRNQILALFGVSAVFYATVLGSRLIVGAWPIFSSDPTTVRGHFFAPNVPMNITIQLSFVVSALSAWMIFASHGNTRKAAFLLFSLIPIVYTLTVARQMILFSLFSVVFFFEIWKRPIKIRWAAFFVVSFISVFLTTALVRVGISPVQLLGALKTSPKLRSFIIIPVYSYIANNFWNLDYGIQMFSRPGGHPMTFGYTFFSGLTHYLNQQRLELAFGWDTLLNEKTSKVIGLNTVSYQWFLFKDFGPILPCFILFLIGAWSARVYSLSINRPTLLAGYFALFASFWALYSPFIFAPTAPQNVIYLVSGAILIPILAGARTGREKGQ